MQDDVLDTAWDDLKKGDRVRWILPNSVRRGTIAKVKGISMSVLFDGATTKTVIPYAQSYWEDGNLCAIGGSAPSFRPATYGHSPANPQVLDVDDEAIGAPEAAAFLGIDPKNLRRMIRSKRIPAHKVNGSWFINRSDLEKAKR